MTSVVDVEIVEARLPFRFSVGHALASRRATENVCIKLRLDDGSVGYGEGVPRDYVTGETVESVTGALRTIADAICGASFESPDEIPPLLDEMAPLRSPDDGSLRPVARCAVELALLDACGKHFGCSVQHWLGSPQRDRVTYTLVFPFARPALLALAASATRAARWSQVKLKVGADLDRDLRGLALLRRLMGSAADIRVDANCAWTADEALTAIERMRPYGISAVEQPVAADDVEGLRRVTAETEEAIIVDESLISLDGAERLVDSQACDAFNIRLSKVGGLLEARRIAEVAHEAGIDVVVGAQVGETGLLSAAGRHLAATIPELRHAEGSFGALLLKQDITRERIFPLRRGRAGVFSGPGLGVQVKPAAWRERTSSRYRTATTAQGEAD